MNYDASSPSADDSLEARLEHVTSTLWPNLRPTRVIGSHSATFRFGEVELTLVRDDGDVVFGVAVVSRPVARHRAQLNWDETSPEKLTAIVLELLVQLRAGVRQVEADLRASLNSVQSLIAQARGRT